MIYSTFGGGPRSSIGQPAAHATQAATAPPKKPLEDITNLEMMLRTGDTEGAYELVAPYGYNRGQLGDYASSLYQQQIADSPILKEGEANPIDDEWRSSYRYSPDDFRPAFMGASESTPHSMDEWIKTAPWRDYDAAVENKLIGSFRKGFSPKYLGRFSDAMQLVSRKLPGDIADIERLPGHSQYGHIVTLENGQKYVVNIPHSPGGDYYSLPLDKSWTKVQSGASMDLGGSGEYKNIPRNTGVAFKRYTPEVAAQLAEAKGYNIDNINVPSGGLGGLGGLLGMAASLALGPGGMAIMPAWGASAVGAGLGAALTGGDVLKSAALGGLSGYVGGEIGASDFAKSYPTLGKIASGAAQGFIGSGGDTDSAILGALTGGLGQFGQTLGLSPGVASFASPIVADYMMGRKITPYTLARSGLRMAARPVYK